MKKILMATTLCVLTAPAFAQINDIINKPKPTKAEKQAQKEAEKAERERKIKNGELNRPLGEQLGRILISRFKQIEISSLVEDMQKDGVSKRNYNAVFSLTGTLISLEEMGAEDEEVVVKTSFIPFSVKLTTDGKAAISTGLVQFKADDILEIQAISFFMDDGLTYKDIKTTGFRLFKADANLPLLNTADGSGFFSVLVGLETGVQKQTIILDNGEELTVNAKPMGLYNYDSADAVTGTANTSWEGQYAVRAGLALKDKLGKGSYEVRGVVEATRLLDREDSEVYKHTSVYLKPSVSYTTPLGKKTSITFGANANISLKDNLMGRKTTYPNNKEVKTDYNLDLSNRFRNPYNASIIINF